MVFFINAVYLLIMIHIIFSLWGETIRRGSSFIKNYSPPPSFSYFNPWAMCACFTVMVVVAHGWSMGNPFRGGFRNRSRGGGSVNLGIDIPINLYILLIWELTMFTLPKQVTRLTVFLFAIISFYWIRPWIRRICCWCFLFLSKSSRGICRTSNAVGEVSANCVFLR